MIHVSDMSWTRKVNHPSEVLKKGDEVEAVVLEVDPSQQRISLGLKQAPARSVGQHCRPLRSWSDGQGQGLEVGLIRRFR